MMSHDCRDRGTYFAGCKWGYLSCHFGGYSCTCCRVCQEVVRGDIIASSLRGLAAVCLFSTALFKLVLTCLQDSSTARFKHRATPVWGVCTGCVCLTFLSANLLVFAKRVMQAQWQEKSWLVLASISVPVLANCKFL